MEKKKVDINNVIKDMEEEIERDKNDQINKLIDKFSIDLYNLQEEKGELSLQDMVLHLRMFSVGMKRIR